MNIVVAPEQISTLPSLIDRATKALQGARSSAEVLEARDIAAAAYDAAKRAARLQQAKGAFNSLVAAANRAQADALEIEAQANRRLADEYDAAQERGEVRGHGNRSDIPVQNITVSDIGLSSKGIYEARIIRDAEEADPGIVRRVLDEALEAGEEPTRAKVRRVVKAKSKRRQKPRFSTEPTESQHDRDLRMLVGVWEAACESARLEFQKIINQ